MKKVIALMTSIVLCISLAACGGESCDHQYEGKITKDATCAEKGVQTFTCVLCNNSYTQELPTIAHTFGEVTVTKEPTCTAEGEKKAPCSVCGATDISESIPKIPHNYTEKVTKKATCTFEGEKTFTCSVCNDSYTETIAKAKHNYASKTTKEATCTAKGTKTLTCKDCNHSYSEDISAKGHNYSSKTTKKVNCTQNGERKVSCSRCGDSYTEVVESTGHDWVSATCTEADRCTSCGIEEGEPLGHTTDSGKCGRCGARISIADSCALDLPSLPFSSSYSKVFGSNLIHQSGDYTISDVTYEFTDAGDGRVNLSISFDGACGYCYKDGRYMYVKVTITNGTNTYSDDAGFKVYKGESFNDSIYFSDIKPGDYTLKFSHSDY